MVGPLGNLEPVDLAAGVLVVMGAGLAGARGLSGLLGGVCSILTGLLFGLYGYVPLRHALAVHTFLGPVYSFPLAITVIVLVSVGLVSLEDRVFRRVAAIPHPTLASRLAGGLVGGLQTVFVILSAMVFLSSLSPDRVAPTLSASQSGALAMDLRDAVEHLNVAAGTYLEALPRPPRALGGKP